MISRKLKMAADAMLHFTISSNAYQAWFGRTSFLCLS